MPAAYAEHCNIHHYAGRCCVQAYFISTLADNGAFSDATTGFTVTQLSHNNDYVSLYVSYGCAPAAPVAALNPTSQGTLPGATLTYSVTVSNADSALCGASTFQLMPSVPTAWTASVSPTSVALSPGQAGSATLTVTVPSTAASGDYSVGVSVSDNFSTVHSASATGTASIQTPLSPTPTPPPNLTATSSRKRVDLSWGASTDDKKVTGYSVWRNGIRIANTTGLRYTDSHVRVGTSYNYYVTARDADGNVSDPSIVVTIIARQ